MADILSRLHSLKRKIKVGVIGVGNIGKGIVYQISITPGMECVAIADVRLERASNWATTLRHNHKIVESGADMEAAIHMGAMAVCNEGSMIALCEQVDVLVDATSSIQGGLQFASTGIDNHKHIIMMNSEADLIFGPYLLAKAKKVGVVYTSADGDQHTVLKRLINDIELWGFKIVMAGNIKGYLDRYSNPTSIIPEAKKRNMDYKMCTSYTDGTKLNTEMALLANSIGAKTIAPGMLGAKAPGIYEVAEYYDFSQLWDGKNPIVDYVLGTYPPGGIFVIGFIDHPHQVETLGWYPCRLGKEPFYIFHRPYHLGHIECVASIAEAYLDGWAVLQPSFGFRTNVYAYAKKDLSQGDRLDGIGGYTAYGLIENCANNIVESGLPICLAENATLRRDIRKDEKIYTADVDDNSSDPRHEAFQMAMSGQEKQ